MLKKRILIILSSLYISALVGCSSGGSSQDDTDVTEIQEIEQTGEFSEDEFFASEEVEDLDEAQLVDDAPGVEEDLEVTEGELEAAGEEGFDVDLEGEEDDLFADSGLDDEDFGDEDFGDEDAIGDNVDVTEEDIEGLLDEDFGEDDFVVESDAGELDNSGAEGGEEALFEEDGEDLALESEGDLFRDIEEGDGGDSLEAEASEGLEDVAQEDLADDSSFEEPDYLSEASENYDSSTETVPDSLSADDSSSDLYTEDISVDVDYSESTDDYTDGSNDYSLASDLDGPVQEKRTWIPVKKMKTVPYDRSGVLVNAIYFVREGDTLSSIGDKIYGSGNAVDFTIVNPHLQPGNLRIAQKVYYNSPRRPQDRARLMTFYDDTRVPAMTYSAQSGENIREISEKLLGHPRSWIEVWAANLEIQSKWDLESPYQIKYWKGNNINPASNPITPVAQETQDYEPSNTQADLDIASSNDGVNTDENFDGSAQDLANGDQNFDDENFDQDTTGDDFTDELNEDLAAVGSVNEASSNVNEVADVNDAINSFEKEQAAIKGRAELPSINGPSNPRNVALNNSGGGFPINNGGLAGIMNDPAQMGIIGGAVFLLLLLLFMIIRRRRASSNEAIEMESFDFGGETVIDDEYNKTQVDI